MFKSCLRLALLCAVLGSPLLCSAGADEKKPFFLPKSPVAAAYVLSRLSNQELIEAPRSEFVYGALLQRAGLDRKYRLEALDGLTQLRKTDAPTELLRAMTELDKKGEAGEAVVRELAVLLLRTKQEDLARHRDALLGLSAAGQRPLTRQVSVAALLTADNTVERVWRETENNPSQRIDLLMGIGFLRQGDLKSALYPLVEPLLHHPGSPEIQQAAILAVGYLPGHESETFRTLAGLVRSGVHRTAAVQSLKRLPRQTWVQSELEPLFESLAAYLEGAPVGERTSSGMMDLYQFATELAAALPPDKAGRANKRLRNLGVNIFVIRTLPEQMLFDKARLVVEAGQPVEIILINDDAMPHNLVVVAPGALEVIGLAAEKMAPEPDSAGRLYVPASAKVLHATPLVEPRRQSKLSFVAPAQPGEYPYVCTFPGHWRRMTGTLTVVEDVEAYLASHPVHEPQLTEWTIADLVGDLERAGRDHNFEAGRALFTQLACVQCHKIGGAGSAYGPDLTDVAAKWKHDRKALLEQILAPSRVIEDRYRTIEFDLADGETLTGMIIAEEGDSLTVQTGPADTLIQKLKPTQFTARRPQSSSVMPLGLLNTLSKEQILDLLSFLEHNGQAAAQAHAH